MDIIDAFNLHLIVDTNFHSIDISKTEFLYLPTEKFVISHHVKQPNFAKVLVALGIVQVNLSLHSFAKHHKRKRTNTN
jgi:hypothetical protein